jgi:hypothetical protein
MAVYKTISRNFDAGRQAAAAPPAGYQPLIRQPKRREDPAHDRPHL